MAKSAKTRAKQMLKKAAEIELLGNAKAKLEAAKKKYDK